MTVFKNGNMATLSSCQLFQYYGVLLLTTSTLKRQLFDLLCGQSDIIDANIINQAGPEGAGGESVANARIQAANDRRRCSVLLTTCRYQPPRSDLKSSASPPTEIDGKKP